MQSLTFYVHQTDSQPLRDAYAAQMIEQLQRNGHRRVSDPHQARFVLNLTDIQSPGIFRRNSRAIFVVSLVLASQPYSNLQAVCYQTLVRTLANLCLCVVPDAPDLNPDRSLPSAHIYFTTPEAGYYGLPFHPEQVFRRMLPIVGARFAIENSFSVDLPRAYWHHSAVVEQIRHYGKVLDELGVLPAPFPLQKFLNPDDITHLYQLFQVKGLSYGNLSAREAIPGLGGSTFWMTARGINKAQIGQIGQEVLLVKGVDELRGVVMVSVPPDYDPRARVSVDAVEHALIYRTFPAVGAIVHVHAWMKDILCTRQNFPCGTVELAREVVNLLQQTPDPNRAVVGLKNHGITITGPNLKDIFHRISHRLIRQIPMVA